MSSTKIGLIGCGRWGANILRDLLQLGVDVWVCDPAAAAREGAIAGGASAVVEHIAELPLELCGYIIASPASQHMPNILALLPKGRPIYVEKPLTTDLAQARQLVRKPGAREHVFVMHKWRYHPAIERLRQLALSDELGAVIGLRLQRTDWAPLHDDVDCAQQLLPHDLSIVLHLLGDLPPLEYAQATVLGAAQFGLWATLHDSGKSLRVTLETSNLVPGQVRSCSVGFEHGVAHFSSHNHAQLLIHRHGVDAPALVEVAQEPPLLRELGAFVAHLQGEDAPLSALDDELLILEHIGAIRERIYETAGRG